MGSVCPPQVCLGLLITGGHPVLDSISVRPARDPPCCHPCVWYLSATLSNESLGRWTLPQLPLR